MAVRKTPRAPAAAPPAPPSLTCNKRTVQVLDPASVVALVDVAGGGTDIVGEGWTLHVDQASTEVKKALGK